MLLLSMFFCKARKLLLVNLVQMLIENMLMKTNIKAEH